MNDEATIPTLFTMSRDEKRALDVLAAEIGETKSRTARGVVSFCVSVRPEKPPLPRLRERASGLFDEAMTRHRGETVRAGYALTKKGRGELDALAGHLRFDLSTAFRTALVTVVEEIPPAEFAEWVERVLPPDGRRARRKVARVA